MLCGNRAEAGVKSAIAAGAKKAVQGAKFAVQHPIKSAGNTGKFAWDHRNEIVFLAGVGIQCATKR